MSYCLNSLKYRDTISSVIRSSISPSSTNGTNNGHAFVTTVTDGSNFLKYCPYCPLLIVAFVPMIPIFLFFVAFIAATAPGCTIPMIGTLYRSCKSAKARALAVLQAMTTALTPLLNRKLTICLE